MNNIFYGRHLFRFYPWQIFTTSKQPYHEEYCNKPSLQNIFSSQDTVHLIMFRVFAATLSLRTMCLTEYGAGEMTRTKTAVQDFHLSQVSKL